MEFRQHVSLAPFTTFEIGGPAAWFAGLEQQGWIRTKWAETDTGRNAKFYSLTAAGRAQLTAETANWNRLSGAINLVVQEA